MYVKISIVQCKYYYIKCLPTWRDHTVHIHVMILILYHIILCYIILISYNYNLIRFGDVGLQPGNRLLLPGGEDYLPISNTSLENTPYPISKHLKVVLSWTN